MLQFVVFKSSVCVSIYKKFVICLLLIKFFVEMPGGKKKLACWSYYLEKTVKGKKIFECCYCKFQYSCKNATKMTMHLIKNCKNCPSEVIKKIKPAKDTHTLQLHSIEDNDYVDNLSEINENYIDATKYVENEMLPSTSSSSIIVQNVQPNLTVRNTKKGILSFVDKMDASDQVNTNVPTKL